MFIRVRYAKYDKMKFVSHLDLMRYFQKAIRRAEIDIVYSEGYSPHQNLSFATPLSVGETSEGEYMDMEVSGQIPPEQILLKLRNAVNFGIEIISVTELPPYNENEKKETAMALTCAADYIFILKKEFLSDIKVSELKNLFERFLSSESIILEKETKNGIENYDIKPYIYSFNLEAGTTKYSIENEFGVCFYFLLAAGSVNNLKPQSLIKAFYDYLGIEYDPYAFQIHKLDTYVDVAIKDLKQAKIKELAAKGELPERQLVSFSKYKSVSVSE